MDWFLDLEWKVSTSLVPDLLVLVRTVVTEMKEIISMP